MTFLYSYFIKNKPSMLQKSAWYSAGSILFSFSSMLWLIVVTRVLDTNASGVFAIGWAICQQMATIGYFGMRNIQVSDIDDKISSGTLLTVKLLATLVMIVSSIFYCVHLNLSAEKTIVALLLTLLMSSEVLADFCAGFFQKYDRLDITGFSYVIRVMLYSLSFIIVLVVEKSLITAIVVAIVLSFLWLFIFDIPLLIKMKFVTISIEKKGVVSLCLMCLPIFVSAYLTNLLITIPKNSIEIHLTTVDQSIFNLIFMPSSIAKILLGVVLIPLYRDISVMWKKREIEKLKSLISKISCFVIVATVVLIIGVNWIGIPVLNLIYNVNLGSYKISLILLIITGSISSLATLFIYILTVFNKQQILLYTYGASVILSLLISNRLVISHGVYGASLSYLITSTFLFILISCYSVLFLRRRKD